MSNHNFAQRYPKYIKQFINEDGTWYAVNVHTDYWHCRRNPDQETKDRLIQALLDNYHGVHSIKKVEELRSYSRIFS